MSTFGEDRQSFEGIIPHHPLHQLEMLESDFQRLDSSGPVVDALRRFRWGVCEMQYMLWYRATDSYVEEDGIPHYSKWENCSSMVTSLLGISHTNGRGEENFDAFFVGDYETTESSCAL